MNYRAKRKHLLGTSTPITSDNNALTLSGLSISQGSYDKLYLIASLDRDAGAGSIEMEINNITALTYHTTENQIDAAPAWVQTTSGDSWIISADSFGTNATEHTLLEVDLYMPDTQYGNDNLTFKSFSARHGDIKSSWNSGLLGTEITTLTEIELRITIGASKFTAGSYFKLYGVEK